MFSRPAAPTAPAPCTDRTPAEFARAELARAELARAELIRAEHERDAASVARDAAETARTRAEAARNLAEAAGSAARADAARLGEEVEFLQEQLRSAQAYHAEVVETEFATCREERDTLLQELAILNEELQGRTRRATWPAPSVGAALAQVAHVEVTDPDCADPD